MSADKDFLFLQLKLERLAVLYNLRFLSQDLIFGDFATLDHPLKLLLCLIIHGLKLLYFLAGGFKGASLDQF